MCLWQGIVKNELLECKGHFTQVQTKCSTNPHFVEPWENISMDFMTQLLEWNGMDVILTVAN